MDSKLKEAVERSRQIKDFAAYGVALEDAYFADFQDVENAKKEEKYAFFKALDVVSNYDKNPIKNWSDLVILLRENPKITHLYFKDATGKKQGPATFALNKGQTQVAFLFIDGEDIAARKEAERNAEQEELTEGAKVWTEFREEWGEAEPQRTEQQKHLLLAMYGGRANSFGVQDKKKQPLDVAAAFIQRYDLDPHKKITLKPYDYTPRTVTETPFSYALQKADLEKRIMRIPSIESGFYDNVDSSFRNSFDYSIALLTLFYSSDVSAKLLIKSAEKAQNSAPQPSVSPSEFQKVGSKQIEQPDLFEFAAAQKRQNG